MPARPLYDWMLLRWWPEYLVLVLLCMAVQIPVGAIALDREFDSPLDERSSSVDWDGSTPNAVPPPEDGWPFEAYPTTGQQHPPTQIRINRTWWMSSISAIHAGEDLHRSMRQTRWGWPLMALWSGGAYSSKPEFLSRVAGAQHFADNVVARVVWHGLVLNSMLFGTILLATVLLTSIAARRMSVKYLPELARKPWMADAMEAPRGRLLLGAIGIGLIASVASSAVAANSLNHANHYLAPAGFNAPAWLTPIDGRLPSTRWAWSPDPHWNVPDRPARSSVVVLPAGAGFTQLSSAERASKEYICLGRFYGWPLTSLADGSWTIEPAAERSVLGELRPLSFGNTVYLPLRVHWPGFILNPILAVIVLWPLVFGLPRLWAWWVVRRRRLSGHCVVCNYDCVGLERCPECGRVVEAIGASPTRERAGP